MKGAKDVDPVARGVHEWGTAALALEHPGLVAGVPDRAAGTKRSLRDLKGV